MDSEYLYVRIEVDGTSATLLTDNSYWIYLDGDNDGDNDYLVEEVPTASNEVCSYNWDGVGSDWGTGAAGCDFTDDASWGNIGSGVRRTATCAAGSDCVEFALELTDFTAVTLGQYTRITAFTNSTENLNLDASTPRNPDDDGVDTAPNPNCDIPSNAGTDDCSHRTSIPEFEETLLPITIGVMVPAIMWRRHRKKK
jgi:hypothetical protein